MLAMPTNRTQRLLLCALVAFSSQSAAQSSVEDLTIAGIHYTRVGSGPPLVIVHGFGGCAATVSDLRDSLASDYTILAPDLPGHGGSRRQPGPFSFRQAGRALNQWLDSLRLVNVRALGISAGGQTLLHAASQRPDRFQRLIVVSAGTRIAPPAKEMLRSFRSVANLPEEIQPLWTNCAKNQAQLDWLVNQFRGLPERPDDIGPAPAALKSVKGRVLIVGGDTDIFFDVDAFADLHHTVPGSSLWIIPSGAHVPIYGPRLPQFLSESRAFLAAP